MTPIGIESVTARAAVFSYAPSLLGLAVADETTWRAVLATATPERAREIVAGLDALERDREQEQDAEQRRHTRAVLEGREPRTPEEEASRNQMLLEAEAERQDYIARRPERIEGLLVRVVALLEKVASK